jgi:signal transduction histidine kinase
VRWRDPIVWITLAVVATIVALYSGLVIPDDALETFAAAWAEPLVLVVAVLALAARAIHPERRDARPFWLLLTAAFGCWLAGCLLPTSSHLVYEPVVWAVVDGLFLASFVLCFLAIEERPHLRAFRKHHRVEYAFSSLGVLLFVLACTASFFVVPALAPSALWQTTWFLIISLDVVLALRLTLVAWRSRDPLWKLRYSVLAAAAAIWIVTDSLEAALQRGVLDIRYGTPLDALWYIPFIGIVFIAVIRQRDDSDTHPGDDDRIEISQTASDTPILLMLYAVTLSSVYLVTRTTNAIPPEASTAVEVSVLVGLVAFVVLAGVRHVGLQRRTHRLQSEVTTLIGREREHEAQRLESIGRLAGGVAHDLNNTLQAIVSHTEIGRLDSAASSRLRDRFAEIHRIAERAGWLTAQLLAFGKRQILRIEDVEVETLVRDILGMLRRIVGEGIELIFAAEDRDLWVHADRTQLEQIVLNLVVNAGDAMPSGGVVRVDLSAVVDEDQEGRPAQHARITVRDTGVGMDETTRHKVFEPFFTTKDASKGTGLGLATVYGIVQQHGGRVEVDSALGEGSEFRVFLPTVQPPPASRQVEPCPRRPVTRGSETILVAEDDPDVCESICCSLELAGYSVVAAPDGAAAVDVVQRRGRDIDLLLLDAVMPRLSGREALEQIDRIVPGLPVVFSTGYDAASISGPLLEQDRVRVLQKPYTLTDLLATVRTSLDRSTRSATPGPHAG